MINNYILIHRSNQMLKKNSITELRAYQNAVLLQTHLDNFAVMSDVKLEEQTR